MALFSRKEKPHSLGGASGPLSAEELFALKAQMLENARKIAADEKRQPNLEDYRFACQQHGIVSNEWNPKIWADLHGQNIENFALSDPSHKLAPRRAMEEIYDQQGTGAINEFYTNLNFTEAHLKNCIVDPATSFNEEIAKAKELENITFRNMEGGDKFIFGAGSYKQITLENVNGGEITFTDNSHVDGVIFSGRAAEMTIGKNAVINNAHVSDEFRIVSLNMQPGATIQNSDFKDATLSMTSEIAGSRWQNVTFGNISYADLSGGEFNNVTIRGDAKSMNAEGATFKNTTFGGDISNANLAGATLSGVTFSGDTKNLNLEGATLSGVALNGSAEGLNLDGARIENLVINGKLVTSAQQLQSEFGINTGIATHITVTPEALEHDNERRAQEQAAEVAASATWNQAASPAPAQRAASQNAPEEPNFRERNLEQETDAPQQSSPQPHLAPSINTAAMVNTATPNPREERAHTPQHETGKEEPGPAQTQTRAPYIGLNPEAQVQTAPAMAPAQTANDNSAALPQQYGQERAEYRAKTEVPNFADVMWKQNGEKAVAATQATHAEIELQGNLQNQKPETERGIA